MRCDAVELRDFYTSGLGRMTQRMLRRRIRAIWPSVAGETVLGLGYATPFLRPFLDDADRVFGAMPAAQGVVVWPRDGLRRVALVEETELPFEDASIDRIIVAHGLEASDQTAAMLAEVWRVLSGSGRVLFVVPNRRSIWARLERTPLGHGHPYSAGQLSRRLKAHRFLPERTERALFIPPVRWPFLLAAAPALEEIGQRWFKPLSGVVMIEAAKQIYRLSGTASRVRARRPVLVPLPSAVQARAADADASGSPTAPLDAVDTVVPFVPPIPPPR